MAIKTDKASIWEYYKQRLEYQSSTGFQKKWPELIRFKEGDQWPAATDKTKYMPRPVINQCDFIVENKQSNILSQTLKMIYSPDEMPEGVDTESLTQAADDYTDAAETTWHDIDQDVLNEDCVTDVLTLGTGIYHYYWDNDVSGGQFTIYKGKIKGENIDTMDIFFDNPRGKTNKINDEQRFIILRKPMDTDTVIEIAKVSGGEPLLVTPDNKSDKEEPYDNAKKDIRDEKITTVLTMYYKQNGEIWWTKVTKDAVVCKPTRLDPTQRGFKIYPIEITVFKPRKKCIYGRSIIEDIIPNQKALNWGLGMMLLSVQQTAWPKIIAKVGALLQTITNEPGEIITDHGQPGIDGIKYMQPPNFSSTPVVLAEKLLDLTRQVTGTTEVTSGEALGANMAAAAIIALQNQAKKPNENYQNKLFRSQKNIGRIWEEFYKCYYSLPRPIQSKDEQGNPITRKFVGTDSADMSFGLKIDVGPASVFSESLQMTVIDKLFDKGALDKYQYVKYAPRNVVPQELKSDFEKEEEQMKIMQQQQAEMQSHASNILGALSPEELQHLKENPQILHQVIGGMQNGNSPNMQGM